MWVLLLTACDWSVLSSPMSPITFVKSFVGPGGIGYGSITWEESQTRMKLTLKREAERQEAERESESCAFNEWPVKTFIIFLEPHVTQLVSIRTHLHVISINYQVIISQLRKLDNVNLPVFLCIKSNLHHFLLRSFLKLFSLLVMEIFSTSNSTNFFCVSFSNVFRIV